MKKCALGLLAFVALLALLLVINPRIRPSHTEPYENLVDESKRPAPAEAQILQRVILYGDAGHSAMEPWQASMERVARRAAIAPQQTVVVALGDNIYMRGYPRKAPGQEDWDEEQLESISYLDAQLRVAKTSGATQFLVPGNHDWYASEVDGQAAHIARYAEDNDASVRFEPYEKGQLPLPESADFPGISLVFVDSEWLLRAEGEPRQQALRALDRELTRIRTARPDNLVVITAHHPLETVGPHGGYLADFGYWLIMNILYAVTDAESEDVTSAIYQRMIADINQLVAPYDRVIYAAGHEHSLQVFRGDPERGPDYTLVSGAANSSKVSGVWHNENTRFALSREGFMELNLTEDGVYLQVFDSRQQEPVTGYWLDL